MERSSLSNTRQVQCVNVLWLAECAAQSLVGSTEQDRAVSHCRGCPLGCIALGKQETGAAAEWYRQDSAQGPGVLWLQMAALVKERDFAVASKHAAAEAAAALETKARATAEQHRADVKALQSQISQLKVDSPGISANMRS